MSDRRKRRDALDRVESLERRVRDLEARPLHWFPSPIIQASSAGCFHEFDMNSTMPTCRKCGAMWQRSEPYVQALFVAAGDSNPKFAPFVHDQTVPAFMAPGTFIS